MSIDLIGSEILGYRITEHIDEGGMGSVWRAEHPDLGKVRAIKVLDPLLARDRDLVERFVQEAVTQVKLGKHPNIVRVENFSREQLAMVMEFVEGENLADVIGLEVGPVPLERALPWILQLLAAVEHAHGQVDPVIHRDIKPSNVLLSADGQVRVMDFGIAKVVGSATVTRTGQSMGTVAYMSPEQIRGARDVDARSDIYSLGVTIYEILAGRAPFVGSKDSDDDFAIREAQVRKEPPDPRAFYAHIPEAVVQVVMRCLRKDPDQRYQDRGQLPSGPVRPGGQRLRVAGRLWSESYIGAPSDGSVWSWAPCKRRFMRGGSWGAEAKSLRAAFRYPFRPARKFQEYYGIRCAR